MPDYQEMYLHLMRETEKAVRILTKAQQDCEEIYLDTSGPELGQNPDGPEEPEADGLCVGLEGGRPL